MAMPIPRPVKTTRPIQCIFFSKAVAGVIYVTMLLDGQSDD